jgi:hypothetical protein
MNKFKEILIYIALFSVIIFALGFAYNSFFGKSERIYSTLDSAYTNSIERMGYYKARSEIFESQANEFKRERDSLLNLEVKFVSNNIQYKKDYSKKTVNQTDNELIEWSRRK